MRLIITALVLLLCRGDAYQLRRVQDDAGRNLNVTLQSKVQRDVQGLSTFRPLSCNINPCSLGTSTWTAQNYNATVGVVVIPCGTCITMDYVDSTLSLPNGLDIQGTLLFPDNYQLTIETPFVYIQGELDMRSTRPVTGSPYVKFVLLGNKNLSFKPHSENNDVCPFSGCQIGFKPVIVAGGKLNIHGLPVGCKTWVHLEDILVDSAPALNAPTTQPSNSTCSSSILLDESFSTLPITWTGGYGAFHQVTPEETFKVTMRQDSNLHSPTWDMREIRCCLIPNTNYLFSARIKLSMQHMPVGSLTTCASSGENCIELYSTVKTLSSQIGTRGGYMTQIQSPLYGVWFNFYATLQYEPNFLSQDIVYQILQIRGPEAGVDVEIDDVSFTLPPHLSDQSNACLGNLVVNGDAEGHYIHPYPLTFQGGYLTVEHENGNSYFRQRGRRSNGDSIIYVFDHTNCLVEGVKYKVTAKIRIHSEFPKTTKIELRQFFKNNTTFAKVIADCPIRSNDGWTTCESRGIFPIGLSDVDVLKTHLEFETFGEIADMDVDDITLEIIGGSISSIVVQEDGVSDCWSSGAEILIASHTLDFQDGQVRKLLSPPVSLGDGLVRLDLDSPIIPPTTKRQSKDFPVEVALLSRNIRLEAAADSDDSLFGAHLMVMQTPDVVQHLEGVEFRKFGQQGLLGRYPIHFHLSLSVKGSLVLKNSIRDSHQRCIVIHGTNDLVVAENVAYKNSGHCYMLEDGGEIGNVFRFNLGSHTTAASRKVSAQETDDVPSTFWCTNPQNEWTGNVAAGSSHSGFWFELKDAVRGPSANLQFFGGMSPRFMKLAKFTSNVAHSNGDHGLRSK